MTPQQHPNRFFTDAGHDPSPHRLLSDDPDRPASESMRGRAADHGNDLLGLPFAEQGLSADPLVIAESVLQVAFGAVALGYAPGRIRGDADERSGLTGIVSLVHSQQKLGAFGAPDPAVPTPQDRLAGLSIRRREMDLIPSGFLISSHPSDQHDLKTDFQEQRLPFSARSLNFAPAALPTLSSRCSQRPEE